MQMQKSMEHWWNDTDRGKPKYVLGENLVTVPLCPPQISHGYAQDRTRVSAATVRRLTT
jgi:hypothetical protein